MVGVSLSPLSLFVGALSMDVEYQDKKRDIDWMITQVAVAIDYYERAIDSAFSVKEVEEYEDNIHKLMSQMKELERRRDK